MGEKEAPESSATRDICDYISAFIDSNKPFSLPEDFDERWGKLTETHSRYGYGESIEWFGRALKTLSDYEKTHATSPNKRPFLHFLPLDKSGLGATQDLRTERILTAIFLQRKNDRTDINAYEEKDQMITELGGSYLTGFEVIVEKLLTGKRESIRK